MAQKRRSVKQLADEARLDVDTALVVLWDAGFSEVQGPADSLGRQQLNRARRALGLATRREFETPPYWAAIFDMAEPEFQTLLLGLGISLEGKSEKLRHKAISRLSCEARKRGVDPVTGGELRQSGQTSGHQAFSSTWRTPGHRRELRWLSVDEVRSMHYQLVSDFASSPDPISPSGVRSESLD
jgi:hypothetical protein